MTIDTTDIILKRGSSVVINVSDLKGTLTCSPASILTGITRYGVVTQEEGATDATVEIFLTIAASINNTYTLTLTDTYVDEEEQTQTETATISVLAADVYQGTIPEGATGLISLPDDSVTYNSVFNRQEALADNQAMLAANQSVLNAQIQKIGRVVDLTLVSGVANIITTLATVLGAVDTAKDNIIDKIDEVLTNLNSTASKTTVTYGS